MSQPSGFLFAFKFPNFTGN